MPFRQPGPPVQGDKSITYTSVGADFGTIQELVEWINQQQSFINAPSAAQRRQVADSTQPFVVEIYYEAVQRANNKVLYSAVIVYGRYNQV